MDSQEIKAAMTEPERKRIKRQRGEILVQLQQRHTQILKNETPLTPATHKNARMPTNEDWADCLHWQYIAWRNGHENPAKTKKYDDWYSTFFPAEDFTELTARWYIKKMRGFKDLDFTGEQPQLSEEGEFVATKNAPDPDQVSTRVVPTGVALGTDPPAVKIAEDFCKLLTRLMSQAW